ncbi:MAG: TolC family protein [Fibrobacter sp.]|nr:TolC family protein [Fibrobacter sp.]
MKLKSLFFLTLSFSLAFAAELKLTDALELALKNHYGITIAKNQMQMADNQRSAANSTLLPTLDAIGAYNYTHRNAEQNPALATVNGITTSNVFNAQLALNWTIFDGMRMFNNRSQIQSQADFNTEGAQILIEAAIVQVMNSYWQLASQQKTVEIAQQQLDITSQRLAVQQEKRSLGLLDSSEILKVKVDLNADSARLIEQQLILNSLQNQLNTSIGRNHGDPISAISALELPEDLPPVSEWQNAAQEHNRNFNQLKLKLRSAELKQSIQSSTLWPTLSVAGNYGYTNSHSNLPNSSSQDLNAWQGQVGVNARWNIFNGFQDKVAHQNNAIEVQNVQAEIKLQELLLNNLVQEQHQRMVQLLSKVNFENSALDLAQQSFDFSAEKHKIGQLSSLEFRDAQGQLLAAQLRVMQAQLQAKQALIELERLCGKIQLN